ncbi:MAG: hypothetical protein HY660_15890 [Armatimonadetes bacterium]|nr:hypothetical protein [Armatimonadota bacterium]
MDARWVVNALVVLSALAVSWLALLLLAVRAEYMRRLDAPQAGSAFTAVGAGHNGAPSRDARAGPRSA